MNGGPVFHQLAYATCAYLLNYPDAAGAAGRVLRPEVAAALPDISPDGRTYTFRIRPGFRFSPPSGQAVTAETFKATIERALSPKFAPGGHPNPIAEQLPDVVGVTAFAAGKASSHPWHHGARRHAHDPADARRGRPPGAARARPSSAPCRSARRPCRAAARRRRSPWRARTASPRRADGQVVLERNPNYTGDRPRRIARIVYTIGVKPADAISRVEQRARRLRHRHAPSATTRPGPLAPGGALDTRYGLASRAGRAGNARYLPSPEPGIDGIAFNTQRPLFRDARMRRAAAYALDRRALAAVFGEQPSDRLIPAGRRRAWRQHRLSRRARPRRGAQARRPRERSARRPSTSAATP